MVKAKPRGYNEVFKEYEYAPYRKTFDRVISMDAWEFLDWASSPLTSAKDLEMFCTLSSRCCISSQNPLLWIRTTINKFHPLEIGFFGLILSSFIFMAVVVYVSPKTPYEKCMYDTENSELCSPLLEKQ